VAFSFRRARLTGALTATLALAALAGAAPAQAHDALASTSPSDGQTITTNPGEVSITLTNPPTTGVPGANVLEVTAPDGHVVSSGEVTVNGATLTTEADIDHDGVHTVKWRAVSADGHPIEGTFSFTYAPEGAGTATASAAATSPAAVATPSAAASPSEAPATAAAQSAPADNTGWLVAAGVIIVILAIAVVYFLRRRNTTNNPV
jgi:copper resistance protein C